MSYYRSTGGAAALAVARRVFTGLDYLFGGTPPGRTDCSGVWEYSYAQVGVKLDRSTFEQYTEDPINNKGIANEPGDLLFIPGSDAIGVMPGHVVGYISPGLIFEAEETGTRIGVFPFDTNSWEYRTRPALALPFAPAPPKPVAVLPAPKGTPTAQDCKNRGVVPLPNVKAAELAIANGWPLFYFVSGHVPEFVAQIGSKPDKTTLYANSAYKTERPKAA